MRSVMNPGRSTGLIYLLASIPGVFALMYVPGKIFVHGDAAATLANLTANETLFRIGIATELVCQALFMLVALAMYDLLKGVNRRLAIAMVALIVVSIPIAFLNELNAVAALWLASGADFLSAIDKPRRDALAMLFVRLHGQGYDLAGIFWGLWLFPMGLLVYRSGFIPRILGVLLIANCFSYVVNGVVSFAVPQLEHDIARWMEPFGFGELLFMFWILVMGAIPKPSATARSGAA